MAIKYLIDFNMLQVMILHFDFKYVSTFLMDLFVTNSGKIQLNEKLNTLLWFYCRCTFFFVECVKVMLMRTYELGQQKLEPTYKPKALRDITYPEPPKVGSGAKGEETDYSAIDIDRIEEAEEAGKKFDVKKHMRKFEKYIKKYRIKYEKIRAQQEYERQIIEKVELKMGMRQAKASSRRGKHSRPGSKNTASPNLNNSNRSKNPPKQEQQSQEMSTVLSPKLKPGQNVESGSQSKSNSKTDPVREVQS